MKESKKSEVVDTIEGIYPDYIVIPGDLYNLDNATIGSEREIVTPFLEQLAEFAEIFYVRGNMDIAVETLPRGMYRGINSKIHLLGDGYTTSMVSQNQMNVVGLRPIIEFYQYDDNKRIQFLVSMYSEYLDILCRDFNPDDLNILLCHDPIIIDAYQQLTGLDKFDLVILGHNHGGLFPKWMKPFFKAKGFDMEKLYPKYIKGIETLGNTSFLVSEGVTKFHSKSGSLEKLEKFHQGTIEVIDIKPKKRVLERKGINPHGHL